MDKRSKIVDLEKKINNLKITYEFLSTGNKILQSTNRDLKNLIDDGGRQRLILKKQIESLTIRLEENKKKNEAFFKMINDMKNS